MTEDTKKLSYQQIIHQLPNSLPRGIIQSFEEFDKALKRIGIDTSISQNAWDFYKPAFLSNNEVTDFWNKLDEIDSKAASRFAMDIMGLPHDWDDHVLLSNNAITKENQLMDCIKQFFDLKKKIEQLTSAAYGAEKDAWKVISQYLQREKKRIELIRPGQALEYQLFLLADPVKRIKNIDKSHAFYCMRVLSASLRRNFGKPYNKELSIILGALFEEAEISYSEIINNTRDIESILKKIDDPKTPSIADLYT